MTHIRVLPKAAMNVTKCMTSTSKKFGIKRNSKMKDANLDPKIVLVGFAIEVRKMRELQNYYFNTRSPKYLDASIAQEKEVDNMTENILNAI